jgi:hypothetical protein
LQFAGAVGFSISKEIRVIEVLSHPSFCSLKRREAGLKKLESLITGSSQRDITLKELRKILDVSPLELLQIKKKIDTNDFSNTKNGYDLFQNLKIHIKEE